MAKTNGHASPALLRELALEAARARVARLHAALAETKGIVASLARKPRRARVARGPRRRKMTAAQREAVAARMKKYWAERRKAASE